MTKIYHSPANMLPAQRASASTMNVGSYERVASAVGGPLLLVYGLRQRSPFGLGLALLGGALTYRGLTGHRPVYEALGYSTAGQRSGALHVEKSVTINRPAEQLYRFWRDFENLPRFMKHLESVRTIGERQSHWIATAPAGTTAEWDAEITEDQPNQLIAWRSLEGADVDNAGSVRFEAAPGGRGTVVRVSLDYQPPAGQLGAAVAKLFGEEPAQQIEGDLRRFRSIMEAGEIATTAGQPSGQRSLLGAALRPEPPKPAAQVAAPQSENKPDQETWVVQEASEESFPASDPPAWIKTKAGGMEKEAGA